MTVYYRPIAQTGACRPNGALFIAGGWAWFDHAECLQRGKGAITIPASDVPKEVLKAITSPRAAISGLSMDQPLLMGILNVTPDSFSDGGQFKDSDSATSHALNVAAFGADIVDIGGESTRPGAAIVPEADEIARTEPVINAMRAKCPVPISIDTRKSTVAHAALMAGATFINDVSALNYDPELAAVAKEFNTPICLMHAQGDPETMQDMPTYSDVLLDVYDYLSARIKFAESRGIPRRNIIVDPGIGFGKTTQHNVALIRGISLFHGLGCPILLGASRKRFIGDIAQAPDVGARLAGSLAATLAGTSQGVQIARVHDIAETRQALDLWQRVTGMGS